MADDKAVKEAKARAVAEEHAKPEPQPIPKEVRELAATMAMTLVDPQDGHKKIAPCVGTMIAARQLYAVCVRDLDIRLGQFDDKAKKKWLDKAITSITEGKICDAFWDRFYPAGDEEPMVMEDEEELKAELDAIEDEEERREALSVKLRARYAEVDREAVFEIMEEVLISSAAYGASREFDENILFQGLRETVFPWLVKVVEEHNKLEAEAHRKDMAEAEKARRARPLTLKVKFDHEAGSLLHRTKPLVLAGWKPAVMWVLDQMVTGTLANKEDQLFVVIRMAEKFDKKETQPRLLRLGGKDWEDCTKSNTAWVKLFAKKLAASLAQIGEPVDLLVCDDLARAGKSHGLVGGTAARKAGYAQKKLFAWCKRAGVALLGGVPFIDKEPKELESIYAAAEWSQLRTHTILRTVTVKEDGDKYQLTIGKDCDVLTVQKEVLDAHAPSRIIIPG